MIYGGGREPGSELRRVALLGIVFLGVGLSLPPGLRAQVQEPPDTIRVDSTLLRIQQRLLGLARPPGIDSIYLLPDSLLPDSILELRQIARGVRPGSTRASSDLSPGDSVMAALKALGKGDYAVTEYESQGAEFGAKNKELILRGTPEEMARVIADGQELTADTALVYDDEAGKVWTVGSEATFRPPEGEPVTSRVIVFDLTEERGTALGATTKYSGGGDWIVHGDLTSVSDSASYGTGLSFTSCELDEPHYHFLTKNAKILRGNIMVARPVLLYFADVPVAWLPFMVQNLETGRASGLLTPTFSVNDVVRASSSYSRRVSNIGFFWAMSDYFDTMLFFDWFSGEHTALTGSFRYNWARQFLQGSLNLRRFWRANGARELAFTTGSNWKVGERTDLRFQAAYASSTSMIRETSFDPQEVVQSINSEGGLSHRFSFGNLSFSANRRQFLSDDRVEMTLPNLSFSLSPQTLFQASPSQARFYNNLTWSGSANYRRSSTGRPAIADTVAFSPSLADQVRTSAGANSGLSLAGFSLSGGLTLNETMTKDVPITEPGDSTQADPVVIGVEDQADAEVSWNAALGYQQRLMGATTLSPSLSISSRMRRADADSLASSFVSAPTRLSLGVSLRTDVYGYFPGFGPFEAIRHKISPGFDFSYAPEVSPSEQQIQVFGAAEVGVQKTLTISFNQTFEAKRKVDPAAAASPGQSGGPGSTSLQVDSIRPDPFGLVPDTLQLDSLAGDSALIPQAATEGQKVVLLAVRTTAVTYDFERAAEQGDWLWGITSTRLSNSISSDYLRGLNISMVHDLFEDVPGSLGSGEGETSPSRNFSPHLSQMNLGFSLDSQSLPFRLFRSLLGGEDQGAQASVVQASPGTTAGEGENPFAPSLSDEGSIIPGAGDQQPGSTATPRGQGGGGAGTWRANFTYSHQRPRDDSRPGNQMLQSTLTFSPTEKWDVNWRTSYDVANRSFNDHLVRLTRDLHRWAAHFDFRKTATGNWSFRFEVALSDQEDLHFDYSQRSIQDRSGTRRY
jgi:hypothetical protein